MDLGRLNDPSEGRPNAKDPVEMRPAMARTGPTDKSTPPVMMTKVVHVAIMPTSATWRTMPIRFSPRCVLMSVLCQPLWEPAGTSPSVTTSQDDCSETCSAIQNSDKSTIPPVIRNAPIARTTPKRSFTMKTPIRTPNSALHSLMAETGPIGR